MGKTAIKIFAIVISCLIILLTVVFFVVKAGAVPDTIFAGKRAVENIAFLHALEEIPMNLFNIVLIFLPIVAVVVLLRKLKSKPWNTQVLYALCGLLFTIFVVLDGVYQPAVLNTKSDIGLAQTIFMKMERRNLAAAYKFYCGIKIGVDCVAPSGTNTFMY